jgi:pyruvate,water dikinase
VPPGFAITALAFHRFFEHAGLQSEIARRTQAADAGGLHDVFELSASLQQLILTAPLPPDVQAAILEAYATLEEQTAPGVRVAMRSSALGEDTIGGGFAGQYRSVLNVGADGLIEAYKEIVASQYSPPALIHRYTHGLRDDDIAMCAGCMAMIPAVAGGVAYSRSPTDPAEDSIIINAAWGLPKAVVDGCVRPDLFLVARADPARIIRAHAHRKTVQFVCDEAEGIERLELTDDQAGRPALEERDVMALGGLALDLERHWGAPQDIEWALAPDRTIYVLQCRELQCAAPEPESAPEPDRIQDGRLPSPILQGTVTASPGCASGPVCLVNRRADLLRFPRGAVLATSQPLPDWASLLTRASAVVAAEGSVTGHLASVARNLSVPALFGVGPALDSLQEGEVVTVDADRRRVFDGRVEALLTPRVPPRDPMAGSPVRETLAEVARLIVPLTLIDPDSPDFRPGACETYHDLTRFCHEKAVAEMFQFGREHRFSERSSKQLVTDVPMQLWVLNLDDGFRREEDGSQVRLSNIVSVPMLALWSGMRAFPWGGPPPVDGKGLLSVMFQATTNPALDPGVQGRFGDRNYFLISRHYCCLQSRFGFHFSTVEALVSERAIENYASFQFKGGGADFARRRARVEFIGDLLEAHGFRVVIREDALVARLEGLTQEAMEARLRILGYLIVHTRQLDMVLTDAAAAGAHRARMAGDLRALTGPGGAGAVRSST